MATKNAAIQGIELPVEFRDDRKPDRDYYIYGVRIKNYRSPTAQVLVVSCFAFATV